MFDVERDAGRYAPRFTEFTYLIFEEEELLRYGENSLTRVLDQNKELFEVSSMYGFRIYKRI